MSIKFVEERKIQNTIEYIFIVNGFQKTVRESDLKKHPGCYEALPSRLRMQVDRNRDWMAKM